MSMRKRLLLTISLGAGLFSGCASQLPNSGPTVEEVTRAAARDGQPIIQLVDIDAQVTRRLLQGRHQKLFSEALGEARVKAEIGHGDTLEVSIWEAPPATLFGGGSIDPRQPSTARATVLPEQVVDREGFIVVPFAGRVAAAGRTPVAVAADIAARLKGKANQPEVLVRAVRSPSASVTVVGEVAGSTRMPVTEAGERVLDALAAAGGVRQPVTKVTLQVTRGSTVVSLPLDHVIRDPQQNVRVQPGDVVTALFQPLSFTALGATGRNEEIPFEAQGITLAQALARAGGLIDSRSSAEGVFIFRLEPQDALDWPRQPAATTPDGRVPVVYRLNLRDPASFFVMQSFPIGNKDVLYVSNAPAAELQKFLNLVFSVAYPVLNTIQLTR
jgi:polysaccharide export outer membrane protein